MLGCRNDNTQTKQSTGTPEMAGKLSGVIVRHGGVGNDQQRHAHKKQSLLLKKTLSDKITVDSPVLLQSVVFTCLFLIV